MANVTRKQLAQRTGLTPDIIRRNEARLGLSAIRVTVNRRLVVYPAAKAVRILRARGLAA